MARGGEGRRSVGVDTEPGNPASQTGADPDSGGPLPSLKWSKECLDQPVSKEQNGSDSGAKLASRAR